MICWHKHRWFDFFQVQPLTFSLNVSHCHYLCPSLKRCGPGSEMLNASQTTWMPAPPATALTVRSATSLNVERQECLPQSAPTLLSATSLDIECRGCLPRSTTTLAPSTLPSHPTSSIGDASPGLPLPSSAMSLDVEHQRRLPCLPLPLHPLLCHIT